MSSSYVYDVAEIYIDTIFKYMETFLNRPPLGPKLLPSLEGWPGYIGIKAVLEEFIGVCVTFNTFLCKIVSSGKFFLFNCFLRKIFSIQLFPRKIFNSKISSVGMIFFFEHKGCKIQVPEGGLLWGPNFKSGAFVFCGGKKEEKKGNNEVIKKKGNYFLLNIIQEKYHIK